MYYRVAIQRRGDQLDRPPSWQWKSTVLSSLQTLFQFLRLYGALPQDQLRVFFSSSREGLEEQLAQENRGHESDSVTAAQFLRERMICSPQVARRTSEREGGSYQERVSTAVATQPSLNESCKGVTTLHRGALSALEEETARARKRGRWRPRPSLLVHRTLLSAASPRLDEAFGEGAGWRMASVGCT